MVVAVIRAGQTQMKQWPVKIQSNNGLFHTETNKKMYRGFGRWLVDWQRKSANETENKWLAFNCTWNLLLARGTTTNERRNVISYLKKNGGITLLPLVGNRRGGPPRFFFWKQIGMEGVTSVLVVRKFFGGHSTNVVSYRSPKWRYSNVLVVHDFVGSIATKRRFLHVFQAPTIHRSETQRRNS